MKVNKTSKKKGNKFQIFVLIIVFLISILIQKIPILENSFKDHEDVRFIKQSDNNPLSYAWNRTWGGLDTEYGKTIAIDSSNNIFVGGFTKSYSSNYDACLIKYDTNGALLWNRTWGGNDMDRCFDIVVDPSDNIYMVGSTLSFGEGSRDFFLVKYNNSGSLLWNRTWGDITSEICYALALDSSNNLYLAGDIGGSSRTDIIVAKFNASGDYLWNCTWKGIFESSCSDISIDNLGNIYIAGSIGNSYNEFLLLKYSSSGDYVWNRTWSGPESSYTAYGLDIDSFDNVYIGGYANNDWCLVKFNTTGDCLWSRTWGGAHQDIPFALAIDSLDNIYIGGHLKTSVMEAVMCVASF